MVDNLWCITSCCQQPIDIFITTKETLPDGPNCGQGYWGMGDACFDLDECSTADLNNCKEGAPCTNFDGGYSCTCADGYFALDFGCYDYDECAMGDDDCGASGTICFNHPGGYSCQCPTGWQLDSDGNCSDGKEINYFI